MTLYACNGAGVISIESLRFGRPTPSVGIQTVDVPKLSGKTASKRLFPHDTEAGSGLAGMGWVNQHPRASKAQRRRGGCGDQADNKRHSRLAPGLG